MSSQQQQQPQEEEMPPALPARSVQRESQRDSRASSQISPVLPSQPPFTQVTSSSSEHPQEPEITAHPSQPPQAQLLPNILPQSAPAETIKTKREELAEGDAHWQWKIGFRAITIIVGLIGIGCAAWIVANYTNHYDDLYSYDYVDDRWSIPWTLITFTVSVIWSAVCIVVFFSRHPNAPVHPGAQVGVDLILWLAFIVTGLFAVLGTLSVASWGSDGQLGYSGTGSGYYEMSSNGTWVWDSTQYSSYYGADRDCNSTGSYQSRYGSSSYMFSSCEEQDAYVNALWKTKPHRYNIDLTATVCQFISLVLHLTLFIWACVDTHYRNSRAVSKDAEKLAADIVMNMVKNGAIIPAPGQAHFQSMGQPIPPMEYGYPQQQYQSYPQPFPGQYPRQMPPNGAPPQQIAVASGSNEKGAGPRYA